jgi:Lrp/AsnC family leucine-responsive transcriptional regulator
VSVLTAQGAATLDDTDRKILQLLQADGRMTHAAIGNEVGLTAPSVYERVRKLESRGIIERYGALVNPAAVGRGLTAFIRVTTADDERYESGIAALRDDPDILEAFHVAGEDCFLIKTKVAGTAELEAVLKRVRSYFSVQRSVTMIAISTVKEHASLVIADSADD